MKTPWLLIVSALLLAACGSGTPTVVGDLSTATPGNVFTPEAEASATAEPNDKPTTEPTTKSTTEPTKHTTKPINEPTKPATEPPSPPPSPPPTNYVQRAVIWIQAT